MQFCFIAYILRKINFPIIPCVANLGDFSDSQMPCRSCVRVSQA